MADFGVFSVVSPGLTTVFTLLLGFNSASMYDASASVNTTPVVMQEQGTTPESTSVAVGEPTSQKKYLSKSEYEAILKNAPIEGFKKAKFTLVEYSDLECPFCIMQFKNGIITGLQTKYGAKINHVFRPINFVNHPHTDEKSMAALCVAQVAGTKKYMQFYRAILAGSQSNGPLFNVNKITTLVKKLRINERAFADCVDERSTQSLYASYAIEAASFNIQGSPTTMIINNETREYTLVEGAYPIESFFDAIESIQ